MLANSLRWALTRQHRAVAQKIKDLLLETASPFRPELGNDLQVGRLRAGRDQLRIERRRCQCRVVRAGEDQVFPGSPEIEVRVAEGRDDRVASLENLTKQ